MAERRRRIPSPLSIALADILSARPRVLEDLAFQHRPRLLQQFQPFQQKPVYQESEEPQNIHEQRETQTQGQMIPFQRNMPLISLFQEGRSPIRTALKETLLTFENRVHKKSVQRKVEEEEEAEGTEKKHYIKSAGSEIARQKAERMKHGSVEM